MQDPIPATPGSVASVELSHLMHGLFKAMTTITFDNFQSPARNFAPVVPKHSVKKVLLFSLLLHIALVLAIASQNKAINPHKATPAPINARLFYAPSPSPKVNVAPTTPHSDTTPLAELPTESVSEELTEPEQPPTSVPKQAEDTGMQHSISETEPSPSSPTAQPETTLQPARRLSLGDIDAAREILRQQQADAIQRDARQAAADYQRLKTHPDIIDPRKGREEEEPEIKPVEVNCEDTAKAILTTISGWAGGTLKCSQRNGFEKFVEKRVNKTP